ncbi:MAG: hypothetical protein KDJ99_19790, partial [Candidatus Competibacteraceae bacterium]|nr:hypothetical protein [Candidatus Competibacteraceae bacterium]
FSGDLGDFILQDGDSNIRMDLPASRTYVIQEADPAPDFDMTTIACYESINLNSTHTLTTRTVTVALDPGELVICTFTNRQRGQIEIRKETQPAGAPESFNFSGDLGDFTLQDGDSNIRMDLPASSTYVIREADPAPDFDLTAISCYESINLNSTLDSTTRTATVALDPGESVIC